MSHWRASTVTAAQLQKLVDSGHLPALTEAREWIVPKDEVVPVPPAGYVVSFIDFHERGFALPASSFFRGLMKYYGIKLHHLNPNGVQDISTFTAICEGYLKKTPQFELWKYFFSVQLLAPKSEDGVPRPSYDIGCASIQLRGDRSHLFPRMKVQTSHKGWQGRWFYLKNHAHFGVPEFALDTFLERPASWHWGVTPAEMKRLDSLLQAVEQLRAAGLTGVGATGEYHARGVAPLMRRALSLDQMKPGVDLQGTILSGGRPSTATVLARLRSAFKDPVTTFPIPGHPRMHPESGAVRLVRSPSL